MYDYQHGSWITSSFMTSKEYERAVKIAPLAVETTSIVAAGSRPFGSINSTGERGASSGIIERARFSQRQLAARARVLVALASVVPTTTRRLASFASMLLAIQLLSPL